MTDDRTKRAGINKAINDAINSAAYQTPYVGTALQKVEAPVIPLGIGGGFILPHALSKNTEDPTVQRFHQERALGDTPMTDPFHSFVKRRREKSAASLSGIAEKGTKALDDVLEKLLYRTKNPSDDVLTRLKNQGDLQYDDDGRAFLERWQRIPRHGADAPSPKEIDEMIGAGKAKFVENPIVGRRAPNAEQNPAAAATPNSTKQLVQKVIDRAEDADKTRELDMRKAVGVGVGGGVGAVGLDAAFGKPDNPLEYKLHKMLYSPEDRVQAEDEYAKNYAQQTGKGTADIVNQALEDTVSRQREQQRMDRLEPMHQQQLEKAIQSDEYLQDATPEEKEMLQRAFQSMRKFAPELAQDEFAVRNYLRESLMSANGPDYATISNLARANRDITGER